MLFDLINGAFELGGAWFTWRNAYQLYCDREVRGVYWPMFGFFAGWGLWNLAYYPSLEQWASLVGAVALVLGNIAWLALYLKMRCAPQPDERPGWPP